MSTPPGNIFRAVPDRLDTEQFIDLLAAPGLRIERIVSIGHATPPGEWLVQDHGEWVLLMQGEAMLRMEGCAEPIRLGPGDHLAIPAGTRHRVEWTASEPATVWLAVHYGQAPAL